MKLFLLDAYALIYRSYYAFIKFPRINAKGQNTSAIFGFVNTLEEVLRKENPTHIAIAFDPPGPTFRHEAYQEYKAQREETPEVIRESVPIIKDIIRAYNIPILEVKGFEADDVIGTIAKKAVKEGVEVYMMTPDKDYGQLLEPGIFIYKPKYGSNDMEVLEAKDIQKKYGLQSPLQVIDLLGLMGDSADNIPGCPGVGEKTAQKLLAEFGSIENVLNNSHQLKGAIKTKIEENKEQILFSKFLATIKIDVPIELDIKSYEREAANTEQLHTLFDALEFKTLLSRKLETEQKPIEKTSLSGPSQGDLFASLEAAVEATAPDSENSLTEYTDLSQVEHQYSLLQTEQELLGLVNRLSSCTEFAFDTETTSINPTEAELVGMSFSCAKNEAFYIPFPEDREACIKQLELLKPIFENKTVVKIGQNIKYDLVVLKQYGIEVEGRLFDTMIAHYILNPELRHNMDYLAEVYLQYKTISIDILLGKKGKNQLSMRSIPPEKVTDYACEDADITFQLKQILVKDIQKTQNESLFETIEMPLVRVLADMEYTGVKLDVAVLQELSTELHTSLQELEIEMCQLAGTEFNINSPKQVGEVLFDKLQIIDKPKKTKSGQYVTKEEVLESLRHKHPIVDKLLEYRGLKKLLSTYIDALPLLVNSKTGKVHTSFNQAVTATGRLSSSNPNLQNIPIRDSQGRKIRKAFVPNTDDSMFLSADYSQIELRLMAHLSGDAHMIEAFKQSNDIHAATAAKIYKVPLDEVDKDMRRKAKTANFGIIYGISVFGLSERLGIPRKEAKELIDGYFQNYPEVQGYMEKSIQKAKDEGSVATVLHRRRFLPDISSRNSIVRGNAERNAINAPLQGSAADIIKLAMIAIYKRFKEEKIQSKMILQVHDELNFSVFKNELERVKQIVMEEMEKAYPLQVPLIADCGVGKNWLEAHE